MCSQSNYILIKNGVLISKEYDSEKKDILIKDDKIIEIEDFIEIKNDFKLIEANNKIVAPGFFDFHSHCDFYFPYREHVELYGPLLFQGVTTCLGGNCGLSMFPILKNNLNYFKDYTGFLLYDELDFTWGGYKEYLKYIENNIMFNFASLTGCGTLRVNAAGYKRFLNDSEKKVMEKLLIETLEDGSFGISSGLMYMPGTFSDTKELIELAKITKKYPNTIYTSHMRGYSHNFLESIKETIKIGQETGIKVHCSHLGPFGTQFAPKIEEALGLIHDASDKGVDITFDSLGYLGGNTTIMAIFPPFSYEKGSEKFLNDIKDDEFFYNIIRLMENYIPKWPTWEYDGWTDNFVKALGWENIIILGTKNNKLFGKNFIQIAKDRGKGIHEALREVLLDEGTDITIYFKGVGGALDDNDPRIKYFDLMIEDDLCLIAIDAVFSKNGITMPFLYGTFPRILNRYVKNKKTLSLKKAIEKFTSKVAGRLNLDNRGYLKSGCYADIVIFDFENFKNHTDFSYFKPEVATGVNYLFINGKAIIENNNISKIKSGYIIRNV